MQQKFFVIDALNPNEGNEKLNAFLSQHTGCRVEREFVSDGANSFWSVCVSYAFDKNQRVKTGAKTRGKPTVDYRDELSPEHFTIYARLRTLRNRLAEEQGAPPFTVFTNDQLAAMAQLEVYSLENLSTIVGIGEKRLAMYGEIFLAELKQDRG